MAAHEDKGVTVFVRQKLPKLVGQEDADILLTGPVGDLGNLASLGLMQSLTQLARGEITQAVFARTFGHRGAHAFEVSTPRPAEDSNWIDQQLSSLRQDKENVYALMARQETARQAAWGRVRQRMPQKEAAIRKQINRWSIKAHERESARSEVIRTFWVLRSFVQRAGELTGQTNNIFFLSIEEILILLRNGRTPFSMVPDRRVAYDRYCALPIYPALIRGHFDPFNWAADPLRRCDVFAEEGETPKPTNTRIVGFPCATGVVEGRVRVMAYVEEGNKLRPGEILVTAVTNVGWTPLFPRAGAIVTDVGAPLSHASIVARELGIPAVMGCINATMCLRTGDQVRVDGEKGIVEILQTGKIQENNDIRIDFEHH